MSAAISFLRFTNAEVMGNIDGVVLKIMEYLP
jgi:very-short-patch-repair endonuclease